MSKKITAEMVAERIKLNLDKDGICKLDDGENWHGMCLTDTDVKNIVGVALGMNNKSYVKPIIYEARRQEIITDKDIKEAGYDPESPTLQALAATSVENPTGIGWSPGIHNLFINKKPARLLVPPETILPTFRLLKDKLTYSRMPLGIDHLDEQILNENKILAKLNPLDVGDVKEVATDGQDIYITDSRLTNKSVQELYNKGELPAFSIVGPVNVHECEREDIDYVLDSFKDIERIDFVEQGGCQTCKTGIEPTELILASKLSMEVDKLTDETIVDKLKKQLQEDPEELDFTDDEIEELKGLAEEDIIVKGLLELSKLTAEPESDPEPTEPEPTEPEPPVEVPPTPEEAAVEARLATLEKEAKEAKLKAQKAVINSKIDAKIQEGTVKPIQREGLLEAGLSMDAEKFDKYLSTFTDKVVDLDQHASLEASAPDGAPSMEDLRASRKAGGF